MKTLVQPHESRQGTILLLVLLVTSLLATAAISFSSSTLDRLDVQRDESASLTAEFAAESGMEYALRRLMIDPDWEGTGPNGYQFPDGETTFVIEVEANWTSSGSDEDDDHDGYEDEDDDDDGDHDGYEDDDDDDDGDHEGYEDDDDDDHEGCDDGDDDDDGDGDGDGEEEEDDEDPGVDAAPLFTIEVEGLNSDSKAQVTGEAKVFTGEGGLADYALVFLGDDLQITGTTITGDVIVTDRKNRAADWVIDSQGHGEFSFDHTNDAGTINITGFGVDGTLFRYTDSEDPYQDFGQERTIQAQAKAPSYSLAGFAQAGTGKTHFSGTTSLTGLYLEDTAVVELAAGETLVVDGCTLRGGLVVLVPDGTDLRDGPRNTIELKNLNQIGGGTGGAEQHLGILAPGCALTVDASGATIEGFSYLNRLDDVLQTAFHGQLVVLNSIGNLQGGEIVFDADVADALPASIGAPNAAGKIDVLDLFEDFH